MEDYKVSHRLCFDLNDSQPSSSFSVGCASLSSDQEDDNNVKSIMNKSNFWKLDQVQQEDDGNHDEDEAAYKWMPSKMRILRKMMSSCQLESSSHEFEHQTKQFPSTNITHPNTTPTTTYTMDDVRVCADCNTTKTPLWRSGPRGPKSLCNACGIRQRKARRAMAAAATSGTLKIKLKHKKKKKKTRKESPSSKNELVRFEDFTSRVLSKHYYAKVFPQDEKEAAILLMALSCGILCN